MGNARVYKSPNHFFVFLNRFLNIRYFLAVYWVLIVVIKMHTEYKFYALILAYKTSGILHRLYINWVQSNVSDWSRTHSKSDGDLAKI